MASQYDILKGQIDGFIADARKKRNEKDREFLMANIGQEIGRNLTPLMKTLADNTRLNKEDFAELVLYLKQEMAKIQIPVPEIIMPEIPEPKVTVNVPPIKIPKLEFPEGEMPIKGWVQLMGVNVNNPLPVRLMDGEGKPLALFDNLTQIVSGGGGGARIVQISGIHNSAWADVMNADGRLRVETNDSTAAQAISQISGHVWSVFVPDTVDVRQVSGANWSVDVASQSVSLLTQQVSGAVDSVVVNDVLVTLGVNQVSGANWSVSATDLDVRDLINATDSVAAYQVSGASWSVNAVGTVGLTDTELRASSVPITQVSGANWSVSVSENKAEDAVHASGDTGFMALSVRNSTNTTFAADGDYQPIATDGIGRVITRPVQVRGLLQTAYVSVANGTETTLLAGVAGIYFDLVYVMGTNNSDAAVTVDLRSATGGGIQTAMRIPANATAGVSLAVPIPQDVAANTWTVDLPDITGTVVTISALFSREV